jgi:hypothetical protein
MAENIEKAMSKKPFWFGLCLLIGITLFLCLSRVNAHAEVTHQKIAPVDFSGKITAPAAEIYSQPPSLSGGLIPSSRWDPIGSDSDQWAWDGFTLLATGVITGFQWRGGYDPIFFGSGGPVIEFGVDIYPSIPNGSQPDVANPPLVEYLTGGNAGQTLAGTFGGVAMYDYKFILPASFQAIEGTKYWVQIEALQHGSPDWGLAKGTGGDGYYFRKIHSQTSGYIYQTIQGDSAFTVLGPPLTIFRNYIPLVHK